MSDEPPEEPTAPEEEVGEDRGPEEQGPDEHRDDGLDLARALTRASARVGPASRGGRRGQKGDGSTQARRSRPGRVSGAHPDERDPQPLDLTVNRIVDDHGWDLNLRVQGVFGRWPELVGPEVAGHCTPESFVEGKLVVRATSTAWAAQLKYLTPTLVRRLNEELGHGTVTVIDVLAPQGPTWKKGPRSARDGRGPRDTYG